MNVSVGLNLSQASSGLTWTGPKVSQYDLNSGSVTVGGMRATNILWVEPGAMGLAAEGVAEVVPLGRASLASHLQHGSGLVTDQAGWSTAVRNADFCDHCRCFAATDTRCCPPWAMHVNWCKAASQPNKPSICALWPGAEHGLQVTATTEQHGV